MFDKFTSNIKSIELLQNELRRKKVSGTYLFHGKKGSNPMELVNAFAKALVCEIEVADYCDECSSCKRIESGNYPDIHYFGENEAIKVDEVRDIIYKASSSSFEGSKKIFILENIELLRKEAANALLKTIEEPVSGTYFLLTSTTLNILPTILSRSIVIDIEKKTYEELGVTREVYDFFFGDNRDIEEYINGELEIDKLESYENVGAIIVGHLEEKSIKGKIRLYNALRDFVRSRKLLDNIDRVYFASEIARGCGRDRAMVEEILYLTLLLCRNDVALERLLELKTYIKSNVNTPLLLKIFFLKI